MGYLFEHGDETIWAPSMRVGRWYVHAVEGLEREIGQPAGVRDNHDDFIYIDRDVLDAFIRAVVSSGLYRHPVGNSLLSGVVVVSLELLRRSGGDIELICAEVGVPIDEIDAVFRGMPQ
ncbi:DUF6086 family protein [Salininema proteolyticum]|uniref:DUF6086 family protein n=1 Tax=Salininema proteolyticum TaxID=1607685 RepID=A0ABV8U5A3_9ACTN